MRKEKYFSLHIFIFKKNFKKIFKKKFQKDFQKFSEKFSEKTKIERFKNFQDFFRKIFSIQPSIINRQPSTNHAKTFCKSKTISGVSLYLFSTKVENSGCKRINANSFADIILL